MYKTKKYKIFVLTGLILVILKLLYSLITMFINKIQLLETSFNILIIIYLVMFVVIETEKKKNIKT